jgi:hypothetical protein
MPRSQRATASAASEQQARDHREILQPLEELATLESWYVANAIVTGASLALLVFTSVIIGKFNGFTIASGVLIALELAVILLGLARLRRAPFFWSLFMAVLWTAALAVRLPGVLFLDRPFTGIDWLAVISLLFTGFGALASWFYVPAAAKARRALETHPEIAGAEHEEMPHAFERALERSQAASRRAWRTAIGVVAASLILSALIGLTIRRASERPALDPYVERFRVAWNGNRIDDVAAMALDSWRTKCAAALRGDLKRRQWAELPHVDGAVTDPVHDNRVTFACSAGVVETFWKFEQGEWKLAAFAMPRVGD